MTIVLKRIEIHFNLSKDLLLYWLIKLKDLYINLSITTLVQSKSKESVVGAKCDYKEKVQLQHGFIPDYLSDIIVICSLVFMIALVVFLKVT